NSPQSEESILSVMNSLLANPNFNTVSPVFTVPASVGNENVHIGYLNEIIIQFKSGMSYNDALTYIQKNNFEIISKLDLSGGESFHLRIPVQQNAMEVANNIFESGISNYCEPNF